MFVFYKSTLLLSAAPALMLSILSFMQPLFMIPIFGIGFFTAGTVITLFYKETSKKNEYYFFYNMGLSRTVLMLTCAIGNFIIGLLFVILYVYVQHA